MAFHITRIWNFDPSSLLYSLHHNRTISTLCHLSMCKLSSEATSSLIRSLQSPHCRLHKLVLDHCTIRTTDCTLLTTAIVSSTTITHLLFIDYDFIDNSITHSTGQWSQTEQDNGRASCRDNYFYPKKFYERTVAIVDRGCRQQCCEETVAIQYGYKELLSDCPLSRDDVVVEWYNSSNDVYKKW